MENGKQTSGHVWAIVLAGGQGRRLQDLTTLAGEAVPKQFCALQGEVSMLQRAVRRAARLVPEEHIRVVVAEAHRRWWRDELSSLPPACAVTQPCDRGTAAGVLLPLTKILRQDAEAVVVLLPADHHVEDEWVLQTAIQQGMAIVRRAPERLVVLGMEPDEAHDSDFGWIVPERSPWDLGSARVERFHEKPDAAALPALRAQGALISSFVLVARASTLQAIAQRYLPDLVAAFARWHGGERGLAALYERIPTYDLSRDLLEPAVRDLWVVPVPPCGWKDLGTPERVARCLRSPNARTPRERALDWLRAEGFIAPLDLSRRLDAWELLSTPVRI